MDIFDFIAGFAAAMGDGDGATLDQRGDVLTYRDGYQVGAGGIAAATITRDDVAAFMAGLGDGMAVGLWRHDGVTYLDASEWYPDKATALAVARERGELAVWDWAAGREVMC